MLILNFQYLRLGQRYFSLPADASASADAGGRLQVSVVLFAQVSSPFLFLSCTL